MPKLPLAMIGGVIGVFAAGGVLSVTSVIGFITVFGIVTRNCMMMTAHIHHLVEHEGVRDTLTAVKRGAEERRVDPRGIEVARASPADTAAPTAPAPPFTQAILPLSSVRPSLIAARATRDRAALRVGCQRPSRFSLRRCCTSR